MNETNLVIIRGDYNDADWITNIYRMNDEELSNLLESVQLFMEIWNILSKENRWYRFTDLLNDMEEFFDYHALELKKSILKEDVYCDYTLEQLNKVYDFIEDYSPVDFATGEGCHTLEIEYQKIKELSENQEIIIH